MLKTFISTKLVGLVLRHGLTVAGGWMLAEGYTDEATLQTIEGGLIALSGVALSVFEKKFRF